MSEPLTMTEWFDHLDELLMDRLGIPSGSLADNPYPLTDRYFAGETPDEVVEDILADPMEWI